MKNETPAWFTHAALGAWDPEGCLVSVIDDPAEAVLAVTALRTAGFAVEHVCLILAGEALALSEALHHRNLAERVFFLLINPSDDAQFEAEYQEEARRGHPLLVVYAPRREQFDRARDLLRGYRAHTIKHYGRWTVRGFE